MSLEASRSTAKRRNPLCRLALRANRGARLRCPVFFPGFWAMLDHRPGRATTLDVVRAFGEPVEIERVVLTGAAPIEVGTTALVPGTRIELPG